MIRYTKNAEVVATYNTAAECIAAHGEMAVALVDHKTATWVSWGVGDETHEIRLVPNDQDVQQQATAECQGIAVAKANFERQLGKFVAAYSPAVEARREAARKRDSEDAAYDKWVTDQSEAYNLAQVCDDGSQILKIDPK